MDEDDLIDELDELTEDELADLLAMEEAELVGFEEAEAERSDVEYGDVEDGAQLNLWQEEVKNFGGRYSSPSKRTLTQEIGDGQLGQRFVLPTSEAAPIFPNSLLLAEVHLTKPVAMDVSFSYDNMRPPQGVGVPALDQGDGHCRLTWGAPGGSFSNAALVDGNRGWRHPFVASFMRLEYIPVDPEGTRPLPGNQARDLGVSGMITPQAGGNYGKLTKTILWPTLGMTTGASGFVPNFASKVRLAQFANTFNSDFIFRLNDATGSGVMAFGSSGNAGQFPAFVAQGMDWPVPQRAQSFNLITVAATTLTNPAVIFTLDL